ncbi:hypothetical protein V2I80_12150 [Pseudomonas viridiflava]|uniref:hypothetical protein n=1 Tax=Pseudomonas viridiflava TaxID=33069 RepID=UPI002EAB9599|nr:hypothetical protein [Pseudomonas viridiflava]MEE3972391.1 hypothetical protein [Pseudomonas viridiflava]MEE4017232.1 hypothetical protein [Pseudomonas viridiflava]MEE4046198.1 hypothetical protein [Pseudomonas viridiflava]
MDYASWSETVINNLIGAGMDSQLVRKIFNEEKAVLEDIYSGGAGEPTSVGVHFIKALEVHDLDLRIATGRGHGGSLSELAIAYSLTTDEVRRRAQVGATKKTVIHGWFRGQEVDLNASLNF